MELDIYVVISSYFFLYVLQFYHTSAFIINTYIILQIFGGIFHLKYRLGDRKQHSSNVIIVKMFCHKILKYALRGRFDLKYKLGGRNLLS